MQCPRCQAPCDSNQRFCESCGEAMVAVAHLTARADASPKSSVDPMVGAVFQGKYKIVKWLGEGGMGSVYLAEQSLGGTSRPVALKMLHSHFWKDKKIQARFEQEVGIVAKLEHPHTIHIIDSGRTEQGLLFLVMEYVVGVNLGDELAQKKVLEPKRVVHLLKQVCGSLAEAHMVGIVHRDIKPDNIMLTVRAGQHDFVKVLDFGIAKRADETKGVLTVAGTILGTPPYMSPEQFSTHPVDGRSDIYSLGVVAYECLTGHLPFHAEQSWEWASRHLRDTPIPFERYPTMPFLIREGLRRAVMKALSKDPAARYGTMIEFSQALEDGLASPSPSHEFSSRYSTSSKVFTASKNQTTNEPPERRMALPSVLRPAHDGWANGRQDVPLSGESSGRSDIVAAISGATQAGDGRGGRNMTEPRLETELNVPLNVPLDMYGAAQFQASPSSYSNDRAPQLDQLPADRFGVKPSQRLGVDRRWLLTGLVLMGLVSLIGFASYRFSDSNAPAGDLMTSPSSSELAQPSSLSAGVSSSEFSPPSPSSAFSLTRPQTKSQQVFSPPKIAPRASSTSASAEVSPSESVPKVAVPPFIFTPPSNWPNIPGFSPPETPIQAKPTAESSPFPSQKSSPTTLPSSQPLPKDNPVGTFDSDPSGGMRPDPKSSSVREQACRKATQYCGARPSGIQCVQWSKLCSTY